LYAPLGQADATQQILEALIRAVVVKYRVDGEIGHPHRTVSEGVVEPLEGLLFVVESGVNLREPVG
jgi:hypothetical protein